MRRNRRKRRKYNKKTKIACAVGFVLFLGTIGLLYYCMIFVKNVPEVKEISQELIKDAEKRIEERLLNPNEYSRPQLALKSVQGVVVHYTANPGTDAIANRNYFNKLPEINAKKDTKTYASSNYIIGLKGDIIRIVPETEVAYASNSRNKDTLSIECCHPDSTGELLQDTYDSLVWLVAFICYHYRLEREDIIRHYDITKKNCPKYFVENSSAWEIFKDDVMKQVKLLEK